MSNDRETLRRWRLVLGRFADESLHDALSPEDRRMDGLLDHVYGRAYGQRGIYRRNQKRGASLDASQLKIVDWLKGSRQLFPASVYETLQTHAIDRFGMKEILSDKQALAEIKPDIHLLKALVAFKGRADPEMNNLIRQTARKVVEELMQRIKAEMQRAIAGRRNRQRSSTRKSMADFDWRATIRANLNNWDAGRKAIIAQHLKFNARARRRLPWTVILCVDQSGSMMESVIYSAVMAAILSALPGVTVKLVVFDTAIVDLSDEVNDPVDVLMSIQLGGGPDIGRAVTYCEKFVVQPRRTLFVLVSDFMEGASPAPLLAGVKRMREAGVTLLGLAALSDDGLPDYDRSMAQSLADRGMNVAALTPENFARWVAGIIG